MNNISNLKNLRKYPGEVPAYVKEAELSTTTDPSLPSSAFADHKRELPIHTKHSTWLSSLAYFGEKGNEEWRTKEAGARLIKAAQFHGIYDDVHAIIKEFEKEAETSVPCSFAIVVERNGEICERRAPLVRGELDKAASTLYDNRDRYPYQIRKQAAARILAYASKYGESIKPELNEYLEKAAGYGMTSRKYLAHTLAARAEACKDVEHKSRLRKLARSVDTNDTQITIDSLEKVACAVDTIDRIERLYKRYTTSGLPTPEEMCFSVTQNQMMAKAAEYIPLTNGHHIEKAALEVTHPGRFSALGDDFVSAISGSDGCIDMAKLAEVVPTLPADDADLFMRCMA